MTDESAPRLRKLKLSDLSERRPNRFELDISDSVTAGIVQDLGLQELKRLRLKGAITRVERESWRLDATLGATAIQSCVVSRAPVTTRIDAAVQRTYCPAERLAVSDQDAEMTEDETLELLAEEIDLIALTTESLSLLLPDYPRAAGAALPQNTFAAPGVTPLSDADAHPFAALSKLRNDPDDTGGSA